MCIGGTIAVVELRDDVVVGRKEEDGLVKDLWYSTAERCPLFGKGLLYPSLFSTIAPVIFLDMT